MIKSDEIMEAYIERYRLDENLSKNLKKQALFLLDTTRELRRLKFQTREEAHRAHEKAARWLAEKQVYHRRDHEGYNDLLGMAFESLVDIRKRIDEKFRL